MEFLEEVPGIGVHDVEFRCGKSVSGVLEDVQRLIWGSRRVVCCRRAELEAEHYGFADSTGGDGEFAVGRDDWVEDDVGAIRDEGVGAVGNLRVCAG